MGIPTSFVKQNEKYVLCKGRELLPLFFVGVFDVKTHIMLLFPLHSKGKIFVENRVIWIPDKTGHKVKRNSNYIFTNRGCDFSSFFQI